ncbi:peptidylprolyl isomerase [Bacillus spongiae]|uniref:Foldase protein PrsA n=1 Tax=Bacillus spongiae TaxID=2683610 RepID=A0ABU8HC93_9BACI
MKKLITSITLSASLIGLSACSIGDDVVVKTNAGNITQDDLYKELLEVNGAAVLEKMIQEKLLKDNYSVSEKEIDSELKTVKEQFSSDEEFEAALASSGLDEDTFKEQIEMNLLQEKAITDGVKVTDEELKTYFEENKDEFTLATASHILVEDENTAKEIKKQLEDGEDFAKIAQEKSTDPGSAQNGGSLGEFKKGDMVPEFSEVAFSIELNKISEPVKSQFGYHIIKVTERTEKTFDENKDEIKDQYLVANAKPISEVMDKLKKDAELKVEDKELQKEIDKLLSSTQG